MGENSKYDNAEEKFALICEECGALFSVKNRQYGNAIEETGVLGAAVEIVGIAARLKQIVIRGDGEEVQMDTLRDILMDLHNYATIAIMMLDDKNMRGD